MGCGEESQEDKDENEFLFIKAGIVVLLLTTINVTFEWLLIFLDLQLEGGGGVEEAKDVKQQTTPVKEKNLFHYW